VGSGLCRPRGNIGRGVADFAIDVIDRGLGAVLRVKLKGVLLPDEFRYFGIGIIEVAEGQRPGLAGIDTGGGSFAVFTGDEALGHAGVDPLHAEIALLRCPGDMGIELAAGLFEARALMAGEKAGVFITGEEGAVLIGADDDAVAAADAFVVIDVDDAVGAFLGGFSGANLNAGGFFALVAADGEGGEFLPGDIGFISDKARPGHAEGEEMLNTAGGNAGVTASAFCEVDDHAPSHESSPLAKSLAINYHK